MDSIVAVVSGEAVYPKNSNFRPSQIYPEYLFKQDISNEENFVYDAVRNAFRLLNMDAKHIDTADWNPLGEMISPGNTVLVKPNLVMHYNGSGEGEECLYTQPSVVAAVVDYICIALKNCGKIIIADAPMQDCDFEKLIQNSGYDKLIEFYKEKGIDISLIDMRCVSSEIANGVYFARERKEKEGVIVNLNKDSEFYNCGLDYDKLRITNYDSEELKKHHNKECHEYNIAHELLKADVVINIPKPKCHRKAGVTGALKNMVGVNSRKEYLPHHTVGATVQGGDEYLKRNIVQSTRSKLMDLKNVATKRRWIKTAYLLRIIIKIFTILLKIFKEKYFEGSWYGNHTISKTVVDLNKIVLYADKNGVMKEVPQRKMFVLADMVISGEKEGPVYPSPKNVGCIVAGFDPVAVDRVIIRLMGFDEKKIPLIQNALLSRDRYKFLINCPLIVSNASVFDKKRLWEIMKRDSYCFKAPDGWQGHIELEE